MKRARKEITAKLATIKSQAAAVTASFALPSDFAPFRQRNEYTTEATALFHLMEEHNTFSSLPIGSNEQLLPGQHLEFIFQDILRNRVSYQRNPTSAAWNYAWCFGRTPAGVDNTSYTTVPNADEFMVPTHANSIGAFSPHGPTFFSETDQNITGMWVDTGPAASSNITVSLNPTPSSTSGSLILYMWKDGLWVEQDFKNITSGTQNYVFNNGLRSTLYTVRIRNHVNPININITSNGTCGCWGHFPAPYILTNGNSIESVRTLGHSILVKNFTSPLNQDGDITGVQPGKSRAWTSFIGTFAGATDCFAIVRDYAGAENTRPLKTGLYGFVKPTEEEDMKLRESFIIVPRSGGTSTDTTWTSASTPFLSTAYLVVAMATNTPLLQNIVVRTDTNGEFETGNQFFNVDKPRAEPQEWRDGMEALASLQQFYENPTHWKRILSTIGSVASVGGRILSLFGPEARAVGMPISIAGDIVRGGFQ